MTSSKRTSGLSVSKSDARNRGARFLMTAAALVIVVAGLRELKPIALPLLMAVFLSALSAPLMTRLIRYRLPKALAVLITVLANMAVLAAIVLLVSGSVSAFTASLPEYQERIQERAQSAFEWLEARGVDTSDFNWMQRRSTDDDDQPLVFPPNRPVVEGSGGIELGAVVGVVSSTLRGIAAGLAMVLLVLLVMVFLLYEAVNLPRKLKLAFDWSDETIDRLAAAQFQVQRYLGYKTLISLATGIVVGLWVGMLGVQFPVLWGLIAFLLNYIPTLGSILAAFPAMLMAAVDLGTGPALLVGLGYLLVNVFFGNVLEPHLLGRRLGMSPLVVFLSLVFWGWMWGPLGMLLSVPLTMMLRIVLENTEDFRWVAQLIAARASDPALPIHQVDGSPPSGITGPDS